MRYLTFIILITALNVCSCQNKLSPEIMAESACECFYKQNKGSLDEKLYPCLSEPINKNVEEIHKEYKPIEPFEIAIKNYMMAVLINMINNCDKYFFELDSMYTNMYPKVEYETVKQEVKILSDSIMNPRVSDSSKILLLHKKISLQTKARLFDEALVSIDQMKYDFSNDSETHWIKAYILNMAGQYELAMIELEKSIEMGNEGAFVIKELIKRKKTGK